MTLREFNEILNQEFDKFYKAKNEYEQKQKDSDLLFKYQLNVPFVQYKEYAIGDYLFFIGTNNNTKHHIGVISENSFRPYFSLAETTPYLEEEVEIAIAKMSIDNHKKSVLGIENSDIETRIRWQKELEWHKSEIKKLQSIIDELQESKKFDIDR